MRLLAALYFAVTAKGTPDIQAEFTTMAWQWTAAFRFTSGRSVSKTTAFASYLTVENYLPAGPGACLRLRI